MATISFEFSDKAYAVLEELAERCDVSISEFARRALLEKMEDTEDVFAADEAMREYLENPVSIPHEQLWKEPGMR